MLFGELKSSWNKKSEDFNILHKSIILIAHNLRRKQRLFDMPSLFQKCCQELPNSPLEIEQAIHELYQKKFLIEGKQLFKSDILKNKKRRNIYNYVLENPGVHERDIRRAIGLGSYESSIHLAFLIQFGFLRMRKIKNKNAYYDLDFDEAFEMEAFLLRNETNRLIHETIRTSEQIRPSELSDLINVPYSTVQTHLGDLQEAGIIEKIQQDQGSLYAIAQQQSTLSPATSLPKEGLLEVRREYDYVGGQIRFKVAVRNFTSMAIHNIGVNLNPSDQFSMSVSQQQIANLPPNSTRGIDFYLIPRTCGQSKVFGSISYEDAYGKVHSDTIEPKEISIKCPLVKPLEATQAEVDEWIQNLKKGTNVISYHSISDEEAFRIGQEQVTALDLNEIIVDPSQKYGLYTGQVKVTGKDMAIKLSIQTPNIILDVWTDDMKQTTGFLAYITNLINIALDVAYKSVEKTKDLIQKIGSLMKVCAHTDTMCETLEELPNISTITEGLSQIHQMLQNTTSDMNFLQSIEVWQSKLMSMFEPHEPIDKSLAIELNYNIIQWFHKIQETLSSYMKFYQDAFDDLNHASDDITSGIDAITQKILEHEAHYGLRIISYLLVLDKNSGICLFEKDFGDIHINPDLVSGFLHALQSFGHEISATDAAMKTLTYENYQFQIESGTHVRAALILRGTPNDFITLNLSKFVKMFEQMFHEEIVHYTGNAEPFRVANRLFDSIFKKVA